MAEMLGRVMMTAVNQPRTKNKEEDLWRYAEIEYKKDALFAYNSLMSSRKPTKH